MAGRGIGLLDLLQTFRQELLASDYRAGIGCPARWSATSRQERKRKRAKVQLQEIDTLKDLKEWVEENMPNAHITEDMYGSLVIHTNLVSTMGGYLHEREGE